MQKASPGKPLNSEYCFEYFPFPGLKKDDLTGHIFSGLTVKGYSGPATRNGTEWVCECTCGQYEKRRSRVLKKQDPRKQYLCSVCEAERNQRQHEEYISRVAEMR